MLSQATLSLDELHDAARRILNESPYQELRSIQVDLRHQGSVVLIGHVSSFYRKQLAQEILRELAVSAGRRIQNQLQVADDAFGSN